MRNKKTYKMLPLLSLVIACTSLYGQTVISDSTYDPAGWSVQVVTAFGASEIHEQRLTGGNPGAFRYMEHLLPAPPGLNDLAIVEVTHIYEPATYNPATEGAIDHLDYSEDFALLNLPWNQAFVTSSAAILQDGKAYRSARFLSAIGVTGWMSGSLAGLNADDFIALDGSNDKPDFSAAGSEMQFGFWRVHSRGATQPPIPPNETLVYQHGIDNFSVTLHTTPPTNQLPIAQQDFFFYFSYFYGGRSTFPVLANDSDPDGDPIRILSVDQPDIGTIASFDDNSITYFVEPTLSIPYPNLTADGFTYFITDGQDSAGANIIISFCVCPIECLVPIPEGSPNTSRTPTAGDFDAGAARTDTLDVDLFRQFRDEVLLPTGTGARFVDLYYRNAPEVMPLFLFDRPELAMQAVRALQMMQEPIRNLIEGDGSMAISQSLVDSVSAFLDKLTAAASDSLRDSLNVELARLGPLQDLVGLSVAEAAEKALGTTTHVGDDRIAVPNDFVLQQNYPNPFNPITIISYSVPRTEQVSLEVYDVRGRKVATLVDERQNQGEYTVSFDGTGLASGVYFARLKADKHARLRKMLLIR